MLRGGNIRVGDGLGAAATINSRPWFITPSPPRNSSSSPSSSNTPTSARSSAIWMAAEPSNSSSAEATACRRPEQSALSAVNVTSKVDGRVCFHLIASAAIPTTPPGARAIAEMTGTCSGPRLKQLPRATRRRAD